MESPAHHKATLRACSARKRTALGTYTAVASFVSRKTSAPQALRFFGSAWVDRTMYALQRSKKTDAQTVTDELEPCYGRPATSKPEVRVARRARSPRLVKQSTRSLGYVRCLVRSRRSCRGSRSRPVVAWARRQRIALSPGSS